jgi:predicted ATP-dependent endonuclease of OLD family
MKLSKVQIHSFRSIVNQTLSFTQPCMGFIGLNEAGKSTLLDAIRFMDVAYKVERNDKSKIDDSWPRTTYSFVLVEQEIKELRRILFKRFASSETTQLTALPKDFVLVSECSFTKSAGQDTAGGEIKIITTPLSFEISLPSDFSVFALKGELEKQSGELQATPAAEPLLHLSSEVPQAEQQAYRPVDLSQLKQQISSSIAEYLNSRLPSIRYWRYDDKYLLKEEMSYDEFLKDGLPRANNTVLYNLFVLSKRLDIKTDAELVRKVGEWKVDSGLRRRDEERVTEDVNQYIREIWKEEKVQSIDIKLEETKLITHIHDPKTSDAHYFDMQARSQGFKSFISFILTIAAEADVGINDNFVLLLDEPETHLHPSGVRFMRNELIKLSSLNTVAYATHSIFMIDRRTVERHVIVKKESERTELVLAQRSKLIQEAVLYEALGTSVDEFSIRAKAIVLEGDIDLRLFEHYLRNFVPSEHPWHQHELYDGGGTEAISTFLKNKVLPDGATWMLVLDSDAPGRNLKSGIKDDGLLSKLQFAYYEVEDIEKDVELEDLMLPEFQIAAIKAANEKHGVNPQTDFSNDIKRPFGKRTEEFKAKNAVAEPKKYEEILKDAILGMMEKSLAENEKEPEPTRKKAFLSLFPKYCAWIEKLLLLTGPSGPIAQTPSTAPAGIGESGVGEAQPSSS